MVPLAATVPPPPTLDTTGFTASASDEEGDNKPSNVLDKNPGTIWHSKWSGTPAPLPHWITIDMHQTQVVSALVYQPRQDGNSNGNIGAYTITTSLDGTNFGAAVASGTLADDTTIKTLSFVPTKTRFIRLTAQSEAGNRGPWTSAAEINLLGDPGIPPTPGDPSTVGSWGQVTGFPLVPVAAALLPNNKLLTWSSFKPYDFVGGSGYTQTAIMDLTTGQVTQRTISNTKHDMFCPGIARLADGGILVTGGNDDTKASIYTPKTDMWSSTADMNIPRGYQAMTLLSNGDAFVIGGSWKDKLGNKDGEVWSASTGTWRKLPGVPAQPTLTADPDGVYRADNHEWLYATSEGRVLQMGPSKEMHWIDTRDDGTITDAGPRGDSDDAMNGNAVAYDIGKILTLGGATAYENADASNRAYTIDTTKKDAAGNPVVARTGDMQSARAFSNSVVLPDGKVLAIGGQSHAVPFSDSNSAMTPELWDPATGKFTAMAPMAVPRNYHSVAILLPDGRVFSGGGGLCGNDGCKEGPSNNHADGQIFTPPYLLNPDGSPKPRPSITNAPDTVAHGRTVQVTADQAVQSFVLVRAGEATHSVDNDQRRVPLSAGAPRSAPQGTTYPVTIPTDPGIALPGSYMLFAFDTSGVPSIAKMINIS
ncbi:discoidin domain-containing protein [Streptomyces sp. NPDC001093]|uniref:discoidin domain-containing protein n=1 Tax=Streptomyces sp. NPDC001093 TaxID=3154376 RepID=UPI00332A68C2